MLTKLTSWLLIFLIVQVPSVLFAQEPQAAVLYGNGSVFLNGAALASSSPVTSGDVIQTRDSGTANVNAPGSSGAIDSNSIVRFQNGGIALDRGSISVASGNGLAVFARDFKISPASNTWTQFYVSRVNGTVQVFARKNSVVVSCGANTSTIKEGQQLSRDDAANCGVAAKDPGPPAAAKAPVLNSRWAEVGGLAAGGAVLGWVLTRSNDVSPSKP